MAARLAENKKNAQDAQNAQNAEVDPAVLEEEVRAAVEAGEKEALKRHKQMHKIRNYHLYLHTLHKQTGTKLKKTKYMKQNWGTYMHSSCSKSSKKGHNGFQHQQK